MGAPTRFEFATANRIFFGAATAREIPGLAADLGRRALMVTYPNATYADTLLEGLLAQGLAVTLFAVAGEPKVDDIQAGTE